MREDLHWRLKLYWAMSFLVLGMAILLGGCKSAPEPAPETPTFSSRVIRCGTDAVRENWPRAYPQVMHCLTALIDSPMTCLDAIPAAVEVGFDVVACIVRGAHVEAARQSERNPEDVVSMRKAERSRAWLDNKGVVFE